MGAAQPIINQITEYLTHLNTEQQKAVLTVVKTFATEKSDWWDEISAEQQQTIDAALAEMQSGNTISHEEVVKKYNQWMQ